MPLQTEPNQFFRRETGRFVQCQFGKALLDVGADRIARTALSAFKLRDVLSKKTGKVIPLAWDANFPRVAAIEVDPAGTLRASQLPSSANKQPEQMEIRKRILEWLSAGADFLAGKAYPPTDLAMAQKEGWIFIRRSVDT